ncbi:MAG: DUF1846 domain-containing protein [Oscillospiraceae bacterium]
MKKIGFDKELYMQRQKQQIEERIKKFDGKLYLEFGGKLFDDFHAERVLPGFDAGGKIRLLYEMRNEAEIIFCVSAGDIEKTKIRSDLGISYEMDVLRLIDDITAMDIKVNCVVITQYTGQNTADNFINKLSIRGVKNYIHKPIAGYPNDIPHIVSDEGYGSNEYIETTKPLVVVTAPGPGSGKLATCLSQMYHDSKKGVKSGYAKFETFPIWNLPLKHPVNLAYEAATADLMDVNMIDPFHLEAYGISTVNYNRDIEAFPIVKTIIGKITGDENFYRSPTDMGVNMAGYAIIDDEVCREAAKQEIIRRYFKALCDHKQGKESIQAVEKIKALMVQLNISAEERKCVVPAREKSVEKGTSAVAIELLDGRIVTGKATDIMSASASCVLNALKVLGGIDDKLQLISALALEPMLRLKIDVLGSRSDVLKLDDVLSAVCISASFNPTAEFAIKQLPNLRDCDVHSTNMLHYGDESTIRKLGMHLSCDPVYPSKNLYY